MPQRQSRKFGKLEVRFQNVVNCTVTALLTGNLAKTVSARTHSAELKNLRLLFFIFLFFFVPKRKIMVVAYTFKIVNLTSVTHHFLPRSPEQVRHILPLLPSPLTKKWSRSVYLCNWRTGNSK